MDYFSFIRLISNNLFNILNPNKGSVRENTSVYQKLTEEEIYFGSHVSTNPLYTFLVEKLNTS